MKNKEHGSFLCLHGGLEEMKPGRVVVAKEPEHGSDIWFYDDGFIKNKVGEGGRGGGGGGWEGRRRRRRRRRRKGECPNTLNVNVGEEEQKGEERSRGEEEEEETYSPSCFAAILVPSLS